MDSEKNNQLGAVITSWRYSPQRSKKFLYYILGLTGGLAVFLMYYGQDLLPLLKEIPEYFLYFFVFLISPFIKFFKTNRGDQEWALYDKGYSLVVMEDDKIVNTITGYWQDYSTCNYKEKQVILVPANKAKRVIKMNTPNNTRDVYMVCREMISMAWEESTVKQIQDQHIVKSPQQKHLEKYEKMLAKRNKRLYGHVN